MEMLLAVEPAILFVVAAGVAPGWSPLVAATFAVVSGAALAVAVALSRFYSSFLPPSEPSQDQYRVFAPTTFSSSFQ